MTTTSLINALNDLYAMTDKGMYVGFILDDVAERMGISIDECDELIDQAEDEGVLYYDGDLYDAHELAEYEREEAEYEAECERENAEMMWAARVAYCASI